MARDGELINREGGVLSSFCLWLLLSAPLPVLAADGERDESDRYGAVVVRCESQDLRWQHCDMDVRGGVVLVRQLSGAQCIRDTDWGVDDTGVWVTGGCRAEFRARSAAERGLSRRVLRCESTDGRTTNCPVNLRGAPVRLLRTLSLPPCERDRSWGVDRNAIWVSRGCRGEFEIGAADGSGFAPGPRPLVCESKGGMRRRCSATVLEKVVLSRQISGTACVEKSNWGWDGEGVWVDRGCRAEFLVY